MTAVIEGTENQLVVFNLASEAFGLEVGAVREIIRMQDITRVPRTPGFVEGVINLRGKVIPVIDPRKRFDLKVSDYTPESRIMVVDIAGQHIGMVVDSVSEVIRVPDSSIEAASEVISSIDGRCIRGIAKTEGKLIILLGLDGLLSEGERNCLADRQVVSASQG